MLLYRGDGDKYSTRNLKTTAPHGYLMTNLNKGGEGRIIEEQPLVELINCHVDEGWNTTHFLSFSEDEDTAFRFGWHIQRNQLVAKWQNYVEVSGCDEWEFVISSINTAKMEVKELSTGVYEGKYQTANPLHAQILPISRIIIIDLVKFLGGFTGFEKSKLNSFKDKEWLVLPANPKKFVNRIEYSSILDGGCIDDLKFYASIENSLRSR